METFTTYIKSHKTFAIIIAAIAFLAVIAAIGYQTYLRAPVNLKDTNLKDASSLTKNKAATQVRTSVTNMPGFLSDSVKQSVENQLGYTLRQKYGNDAENLSGVVRIENGYDEANNYSFIIDVSQKNESYLVTVNVTNGTATISCAIQSQQMNPDSSKCTTPPSVDSSNFPNG